MTYQGPPFAFGYSGRKEPAPAIAEDVVSDIKRAMVLYGPQAHATFMMAVPQYTTMYQVMVNAGRLDWDERQINFAATIAAANDVVEGMFFGRIKTGSGIFPQRNTPQQLEAKVRQMNPRRG